MKVIILAGGFGTRLSEYTDKIPKPMVTIGSRPIIWHIMRTYASFGYNDFYLALGYKAELIKDYFLHYRSLNTDFTVDLSNGSVESHQTAETDWRVTLVDTGLETMTGGRIKRLKKFIGNEPFMLTYGDGVANIDIDALLKFHKSSMPWTANYFPLTRVQDWINLLGFVTVGGTMYFYRPPINNESILRRLQFMELAGRRWWPALSGAYILVAKNKALNIHTKHVKTVLRGIRQRHRLQTLTRKS